jgi:hypothetical protein
LAGAVTLDRDDHYRLAATALLQDLSGEFLGEG